LVGDPRQPLQPDALVAADPGEATREGRGVGGQSVHGLGGQRGLANAAHAGNCSANTNNLARAQGGAQGTKVRLAADEAWGAWREVARAQIERLERREVGRQAGQDKLVEALGVLQVLEPVHAQGAQRRPWGQVVRDEFARGGRKQHLATMPGGGDAGGAVHIHAHIPGGTEVRHPGMQPHAHANRDVLWPSLPGKCRLSGCDCPDGVVSTREGEEEGIALGVDLAAATLCHSCAQQLALGSQHFGVLLTQRLQKASGSFDIGKEEGDRAGG
jgi:hypothetical protein